MNISHPSFNENVNDVEVLNLSGSVSIPISLLLVLNQSKNKDCITILSAADMK